MSRWEEQMALQIRAAGLPEPQREYRAIPGRRWRIDFAWPQAKLALEVEGGVWTRGRHVRGAGFRRDAEKYNQLVLEGWKLLRVMAEHVQSGEALRWVEEALTDPQVPPAGDGTDGVG